MLILTVFVLLLISLVNANKVDVTPTKFDSGLSDIQWLSADATTLLVLTNKGRIWRSTDSGRNFSDITETILRTGELSNKEVRVMQFQTIKVHPTQKGYAVLMTVGNKHFATINGGITWHPLGKDLYIHQWIWHPLRPTHALLSEWSEGCRSKRVASQANCNHRLYVTSNGGVTIYPVAEFVIQYSWGDKTLATHTDAIFLTQHTNVKANQPRWGGWHDGVDFVKLTEYGANRKTLVKGGNKFLVARNFIFVATVDDFVRQTVALMVSRDGGKTFDKAQIPIKLKEKSYTVLDTSEGNVLIHVNHGLNQPGLLEGNVYVSDETGLRYSLSLPNNIRAPSGECEFDRVMGVDGVYIANVRDELLRKKTPAPEADFGGDNSSAQGDALENRHQKALKTAPVVRTVITFDKGGSWSFLKPPIKDSVGRPVDCPEPSRCWLHLHGITHFDRFAPFYSSENALGMIMGTGNVGSHLTKEGDPVNTYISRDAGRTWNEAHKGGYIYEYGDHGGLVVMANDNKKTDQVIFSWNEGRTWYDFTLGTERVSVDNVIIEPTATSLEFLLYGTQYEKGVLYHLDFSTLQQPACRGADTPDLGTSDYQWWSPSDSDNGKCMLGREVKYVRKKITSECFNGREFARDKSKVICECTRENYMCETGFFRPVNDAKADCEPSPYEDREYMKVEGCTSSGVYYTHAWRKIPGDECKGGWKPEKVPVPCPPNSPLAGGARATLWAICGAVVGVGFLSWASKHPLLKQYVQRTGLDQFVEVGYSVVGRAGESVQRGGEELFNFWTGRSEDNAVAISNTAIELNNKPPGAAVRMDLI